MVLNQNTYWWEEWVWKEHIIPSWFDTKNKVKIDEQNLGYQFFYNDKPLWMYIGELETLEYKERLLDVLMRGDAISRLKAMVSLEQIADEDPYFLDILHIWNDAECEDDLVDNGASLAFLPRLTQIVKELVICVNETQFLALQDYAKAIWWRLDPSIDEDTRVYREELSGKFTAKRKSRKKQLQAMAIKKTKREPTELDLLFPWIPIEDEDIVVEEAGIQQQFDWSPKPPTKPIKPAKPISSPSNKPKSIDVPISKPTISTPRLPPTPKSNHSLETAIMTGKSRLPPIPGKKR